MDKFKESAKIFKCIYISCNLYISVLNKLKLNTNIWI